MTAVVLAGTAVAWTVALPRYRPGLEAGQSYGVDVSNHQGDIDWQAVADDDIEFAYVKATEGGDFVDARFADNWREARAAGLEVGAYHFFTLCRPGAEQAANFLATVPPGEADLPPVIDLEFGGNCSARPAPDVLRAEVEVWIETVEAATGDDVVLYVMDDFDDRYGITDAFERDRWERRILRRPERDWVFWQLSFFSQVDGIEGGVDLDVRRAPAADR
ncbi:MAG: GH25 family lysozyme [Acidimicrobiales bacterium]